MFGGARAFKDMFDEAMQGGRVEVRMPSRTVNTWRNFEQAAGP